ncbi:MAG TPA: 2,3-bisphosphoglycerate-independent phosphoglycerate mutase [Sphingobacteriaceae bacterium]|nr:2,3-bisphosphoglycerate-independent phosphoglycerate mutase [Sphingobacteriaceae bacterium]
MPGPVVLVVLDGWGLRGERDHNAVALAQTPCFDDLWQRYPHSTLTAHGEEVGLAPGQMGNSNVGHLNLGAGRIVYQIPVIIDRAIAGGDFFTNPVLTEAMAKARGRTLHLMGLFSDGGVHSHLRHLLALWELADRSQVERVAVHCFLDGRDVPPRWVEKNLADVVEARGEEALGSIATIMGRYYAMDRDRRWERTKAAYDAMVAGQGLTAPDPRTAVREAYRRGETDEFVQPTVLVDDQGRPRATVADGDVVIFFNFRADRARQLVWALTEPDFDGWERGRGPAIHLATMAPYEDQPRVPAAFYPMDLTDTFGEVVSRHGLRQLRLAETEKYAHVTYFFNGGREEPFPGEERILVPSPKVATYDLKPEMSAPEVTGEFLAALAADRFDTAIVNYANPDMVGHTGVLEAAIRACEAVDQGLERMATAVLRRGGALLVVADHGNAEMMLDPETGEPHTAHTTNPVPAILVADNLPGVRLADGILANVAPTLLELLGIPAPPAMTHPSLLQHDSKDQQRRYAL